LTGIDCIFYTKGAKVTQPFNIQQKSVSKLPFMKGRMTFFGVTRNTIFLLTSSLHKKRFKKQLGVLNNLYSATFERITSQALSIF